MLSRAADNLYWFGRYLQRAENTARIVSVHQFLLLDLPRTVEFGWSPLVEILGADSTFHARYADTSEANVVRFLITDRENPGSILSSLHSAREILRTIRESMPRDLWERYNDLFYYVQERGERQLPRGKRQELLTRVTDGALQMYGVLASNMNRDVGFQFLRLGTNLEQADMTTRIIDVRSSNLIKPITPELAPFQSIQWMGVLRSLAAYQMFRRQMRTRVNGSNVLRFLLQSRDFPRSVMFCLQMLRATQPYLPHNRAVERQIERLRALVIDADVEQLLQAGIHDLMDEIQLGLADLHEVLAEAYFNRA